ncbi:MAG TPA: DUF4258 domain-containing protein [Beijerinckia sp.]|nr:DUF4258 domain-containing protein [Beijerinckia sp.]
MEPKDELLQAWEAYAHRGRFRPAPEITDEGLVLGAGTFLARVGQDERGRQRLILDDEQRILALLSTAYERPVTPHIVTKLRRAAELWNGGEKALAHIHLSHARLPPCNPMDEALRLFVADELIETCVAPTELMKAQGFDPAPLEDLDTPLRKAHFNPAQPRWPAGNGRASGEWLGGASVTPAGWKDFIARLAIEAARRAAREAARRAKDYFAKPKDEAAPELNPVEGQVAEPESTPPELPEAGQAQSPPKPSDFVGQDFGKLGVGVDKPELNISEVSSHAIDAMANRDGSLADVESTIADPLLVLQQRNNRYYYLSDRAAVVLSRRGEVIITYPASEFDPKVKEILDYVHQGGKK